MRTAVVAAITACALALVGSSAIAGTVKFNASPAQVDLACINAGGTSTTEGAGTGTYGCKTKKGEVKCDKNSNCTGTCSNCGSKTATRAQSTAIGGILTNAGIKGEAGRQDKLSSTKVSTGTELKAKESSTSKPAGPPKAGLLDSGSSASKTGSSKTGTKTQTTTDPVKTTTTGTR